MASNRPRRRGQEQEQKASPSKGKLNNMELLGIGFFCLAFLLWGMSKCGNTEEEPTEPIVTEEVVDTSEQVVENPTPIVQTLPARRIDTTAFKNKLYIVTDSLRMRKEPQIGAEVVGYLRLGEEVVDLGERTALEKIRVSVDEVRTAPWIKLKTEKGIEGWAFGAYMQFYPLPTETNVSEPNPEPVTPVNGQPE